MSVFDGYVPLTSCQRSTEPISSKFMFAPMFASYAEPAPQSPECMLVSGVSEPLDVFGGDHVVLSSWNEFIPCWPAQVAPGRMICWASSCHDLTGHRLCRIDMYLPSGPLPS